MSNDEAGTFDLPLAPRGGSMAQWKRGDSHQDVSNHSDRSGQYLADLYGKALGEFVCGAPWADVAILATTPRPRTS
jgi:hypothetical protein